MDFVSLVGERFPYPRYCREIKPRADNALGGTKREGHDALKKSSLAGPSSSAPHPSCGKSPRLILSTDVQVRQVERGNQFGGRLAGAGASASALFWFGFKEAPYHCRPGFLLVWEPFLEQAWVMLAG